MEIKPEIETVANIKVIGVGGGGSSAVNRMLASRIHGVEFLVANTDAQALYMSQANTKLHIGKSVTKGLGAGMDPLIGAKAAEESQNEIRDALAGAHMVFITCGLGGGTGTGAAPIVAELARDIGALTIAVVTKPFAFEGKQRARIAEEGWQLLSQKVDAIITIPNDKILQIIDKKTTVREAFMEIDEILQQGVLGISELITVPAMVNLDFADVKKVMANAGSALMGIGIGSGENRAVEAAKAAISSPLLDLSTEGAKGVLLMVSGGSDLGMLEINEAAKIVTSSADPDATIIFGASIDESLGDEIRISVIATGFRGRDDIVSKAPKERQQMESRPMYSPSSPTLFNPPMPRPVMPAKPPMPRPEESSRSSDEDSSYGNDDDDEIEIPPFIRKKLM